MIIPCIDLQGGKAVQLVRGRRRALAVDDVLGLLEAFRDFSILHVIDLDAAMRRGTNSAWVRRICGAAKMKVRVGGGIRTVARAERIIGWGAAQVIVGSAAFAGGGIAENFLGRLAHTAGRERIVIALDSDRGRIAVRGWRRQLPLEPQDVIAALEPFCSGFLSTFVDHEGTMQGTDLRYFRELRKITKLPVTAAGGIRSMREVQALERLGMDAAIGMAMYTGKLTGGPAIQKLRR